MDEISKHGAEVARYFSTKHGGLISIRAKGITLIRHLGTDWKVLAHKKDEVSLEQWTNGKKQHVAGLPTWKVGVESLPSMDTIAEWVSD